MKVATKINVKHPEPLQTSAKFGDLLVGSFFIWANALFIKTSDSSARIFPAYGMTDFFVSNIVTLVKEVDISYEL
jgi:hypothetical protein